MNPTIIKVYQIKGTHLEKDYHGSGWGWLVITINDDLPFAIIYHPTEQHSEVMPEHHFDIDFSDEKELEIKVYWGMYSCYEFCAMKEIL
jgi:hypothetical protein